MEEFMCSSCGRIPCHVHSMGQEYVEIGHTYRNATGNSNKAIRHKLYSRYIREVYVLVQWALVQPKMLSRRLFVKNNLNKPSSFSFS